MRLSNLTDLSFRGIGEAVIHDCIKSANNREDEIAPSKMSLWQARDQTAIQESKITDVMAVEIVENLCGAVGSVKAFLD